MELLETAWKNFRNLEPRRQKWCSGLNILVGSNGAGKTNLLESLNVLCGWGPFSGNKTSVLPSWNVPAVERKALLGAQASGEREFEVSVSIGARAALKVGNERVTYSFLRSLLPSFSFLPQDVHLIDGSPSVRRLFLDKLCALCSPLYARRLAEYRQLVRHRTAFLRSSRSPAATTVPLVKLGGWIWSSRRRMLELLQNALQIERVRELLPFEVGVCLDRRVSMKNGGSGEAASSEGDEDFLNAMLAKSLERERYARSVLVGPHRDDLSFECMEKPASLSLSRGQKRRLVAATVIAAGSLIEKQLRMKPILLLDDITAELDEYGRTVLGKTLQETGWQVFVTGVEDPFRLPGSGIYNLMRGRISDF